MAKRKVGLHKEISSIFDGVPLPKNNGDEKPQGGGTLERPGYIPPVPKAPVQPPPQFAASSGPPSQPKSQRPVEPPKPVTQESNSFNIVLETIQKIPVQKYFELIKNKLLAPKPGVDPVRQKAMVIMMPILFVIMIFVFGRALGTGSGKEVVAKDQDNINPVKALERGIDWQIPAQYPTTIRDPMQLGSAGTSQVQMGGLSVKGIVYSDKPSAVVGTQIVYEGDVIFGATVLKITENSVEFERNNERWVQKVQN